MTETAPSPSEMDQRLADAVEKGRAVDVRKLLDDGASPHACHKEGMTVLQRAVYLEYYDIAEILLKKGADANAVFKDSGNTALHYACNRGSLAMVKMLVLEYNAAVDVPNIYKQTALHRAATGNRLQICQFLVEHGADPLQADYLTHTAGDIAKQGAGAKRPKEGFSAVAQYLTGEEERLRAEQESAAASEHRQKLLKDSNYKKFRPRS